MLRRVIPHAARRAFATHAASRREKVVTLAASKPESLLPALARKLEAWSRDEPHLLLYALSKSLPRPILSEAVGALYDTPATARVGFLSAQLPASLVRTAGSNKRLHAISLAAIPVERGIAFRSTIPGTARIAVGRWMSQKETWKQGTEARSDRLDQVHDWRPLWGKENFELRLPEALSNVKCVPV